jgi:hypothetical protein
VADKRTIDVKLSSSFKGNYFLTVTAFCSGNWGLHPDITGLPNCWTVTHIPSGMRAGLPRSKGSAVKLFKLYAKNLPEFMEGEASKGAKEFVWKASKKYWEAPELPKPVCFHEIEFSDESIEIILSHDRGLLPLVKDLGHWYPGGVEDLKITKFKTVTDLTYTLSSVTGIVTKIAVVDKSRLYYEPWVKTK